MSRRITVLGPQRRPSIQSVLEDLDEGALVATVTAGWLERESDDAELSELVGRRTVNLSLHARWLAVHEQDREYAHAEREHDAALAELRRLYLTQLDHALQAAYDVAHRSDARPRLRNRALDDALQLIQLLDRQHLARIREAHQAFYDAWRPHERPAIAAQRDQVREALTSADAVVIPGGHVGELLRVLHLFHVEPHLPGFVVAWSAGAMALTERVVLFHDFVPHGVAQTEVFGEGLGVIRDLVPLPHARRRLKVDDPVRLAVLARRFAPARCVVLDDGVRLPLGPDGSLPAEAKLVGPDGRIGPVEAA